MTESQKLYTRMRLWEFPDQYVIEPTDATPGPCLSISRVDASLNLIGLFALPICIFFSNYFLSTWWFIRLPNFMFTRWGYT